MGHVLQAEGILAQLRGGQVPDLAAAQRARVRAKADRRQGGHQRGAPDLAGTLHWRSSALAPPDPLLHAPQVEQHACTGHQWSLFEKLFALVVIELLG